MTTIAHAQTAARLRAAVARLVRMLRQHDTGELTLSLLSTLATVEERGPIRLGDVADAEHVSAPTATRLVAALVTAGYVDRDVDPDDRRSAFVRITPAGSAALGQVRQERTARLSTRLGRLSADELRRLVDALPVLEALSLDE